MSVVKNVTRSFAFVKAFAGRTNFTPGNTMIFKGFYRGYGWVGIIYIYIFSIYVIIHCQVIALCIMHYDWVRMLMPQD